MYIWKGDFGYFEGLYKKLDDEGKSKFLNILLRAGGKRSGEDISKITVVGTEIIVTQEVEPGQLITRTMIKKAYKEALGGKQLL